MGELDGAPVRFEAAVDIAEGGVLLAMMALARLTSIEQLRYEAPGEWGNLLGLDRVPEVRCLRSKLALLSRREGQAAKWNTELAKDWMGQLPDGEMLFYIDGHVRVYQGSQTALPRHYVVRQRLCLRATTGYWINAMDGPPSFYVNKEADPGLLATMREDLVPWLEAHAPVRAEHRARMEADPRQPLFTLIFDREGYSPDFFREMEAQRIAILSYHKFAGADWPVEEFPARQVKLAGGETVAMALAERVTALSNGLAVREIRKRNQSGHQVSIVTTNRVLETERLAAAMFARWTQENFFKYMREHYGLDRLAEYAVGPVPATVSVVNPARRKIDAGIRTLTSQISRSVAQFGALSLEGPLEPAQVARYQTQKSDLQERIDALQKDLAEPERFQRLLPERKHLVDTIKLIAYRAETSMASGVREKLARHDDARPLLRQIFDTEVDLAPDLQAKTLTVRLHHLAQNAHDVAVRHLCDQLNATETLFPDTGLRVVYKIGSN